jgi:hypothetical protein
MNPSDQSLFVEALALPAAERAAFLDQACAGDPARRARLESLLRAQTDAGSSREEPATSDVEGARTIDPRPADANGAPPDLSPPSLLRQSITTLLLAGTIFLFDVLIAQQGFISLLAVFVAVAILVPRALFAWKKPGVLRLRLFRAGIYVGCGLAGVGLVKWNNRIAHERAEQIIAACQQFKTKHQRFPDQLSELVPEFLPQVPVPRPLTLNPGQFWYLNSEQSNTRQHLLIYTSIPPFGKRRYSLEEGRWIFYD